MPADPVEAVTNTARTLWWLVSNPWLWLLMPLGVWLAAKNHRDMERKDIEEWRERIRQQREK